MENQTIRTSQQLGDFKLDDTIKQESGMVIAEEKEEVSITETKEDKPEPEPESIEHTDSKPKQVKGLPFETVKVSYPIIKEQMFSNYMIYKVSFEVKGKELFVNRRFNDFVALRKAMRKQLPCQFILPAHKKQLVVG